jgi:hypothetical protein
MLYNTTVSEDLAASIFTVFEKKVIKKYFDLRERDYVRTYWKKYITRRFITYTLRLTLVG